MKRSCLVVFVFCARLASAEPFDFLSDGKFGKPILDVRARIELADLDAPLSDDAQAYTLRTRLGWQSSVWHGLSFLVEGENATALRDDSYFDGVGTPNGESLIADPKHTELNQAYLKFERPEGASSLAVGRQRILLDDQRFIGNVGWRQNEQTYDSILLRSSLGVPKLTTFYGYLSRVQRIWGNKEHSAPPLRNLDSNSHLANVSYAHSPALTATAFAYLLDFSGDAPDGFSSDTFGVRVNGARELAGPAWKLGYAGSYAVQHDSNEHPVDYRAPYLALDLSVTHAPLGALGAGYELKGSDDGKAQFLTPLATLHAFDGWADAFLDNGGPNGLEDFYVYVTPALPLALLGRVQYHWFRSDEGRTPLASELDVMISKAINPRITVLSKAAFFDGRDAGPADRWRFWLELTFKL